MLRLRVIYRSVFCVVSRTYVARHSDNKRKEAAREFRRHERNHSLGETPDAELDAND